VTLCFFEACKSQSHLSTWEYAPPQGLMFDSLWCQFGWANLASSKQNKKKSAVKQCYLIKHNTPSIAFPPRKITSASKPYHPLFIKEIDISATGTILLSAWSNRRLNLFFNKQTTKHTIKNLKRDYD